MLTRLKKRKWIKLDEISYNTGKQDLRTKIWPKYLNEWKYNHRRISTNSTARGRRKHLKEAYVQYLAASVDESGNSQRFTKF